MTSFFQRPSEVMEVIDRYAAENGFGHKAGFSFAVDALWALALGKVHKHCTMHNVYRIVF